MKTSQLIPKVKEGVQFTLKSRKFVPKAVGCYVLTTFEDDVLYVGLTDNLNRRFFEHRDTKEKCNPTKAGLAFWFYFLVSDEREINRIERGWLNQHLSLHGKLPILNKVHSPVR
jgi:predicted GIY-YIG superfamily endonuclease